MGGCVSFLFKRTGAGKTGDFLRRSERRSDRDGIKNAKANEKNAGFTKEEREKFAVIKEKGFVDSFRMLYPDTVTYSWWSYRFQARQRNAGWRLDYFMISESLKDAVADAKIHTEILGSDHCPVELDLEV